LSSSSSKPSEPSLRLRFTKAARIIFEETTDPTANAAGHLTANYQDNGGATQWFCGGVDLCCPPPSSGADATACTGTGTGTVTGAAESAESASVEVVADVDHVAGVVAAVGCFLFPRLVVPFFCN
jgi:hypothetical protein